MCAVDGMESIWVVALLLVSACGCAGAAECPLEVISSMQFAVEYAAWRGWHQALIFDEFLDDVCRPWSVVRLSKCLSVNGVGSATAGAAGAAAGELARSVRVATRLGLLHFTPHFSDTQKHPNNTELFLKLFKKLFELDANTEPYDWLVVARSPDQLRTMRAVLRDLPMRFDQNLVVAYPARNPARTSTPLVPSTTLCRLNFIQDKQEPIRNNNVGGFYVRGADCGARPGRRTSNNCSRSYPRRRYYTNYYKTSKRFSNLTRNAHYRTSTRELPLWLSGVLAYNYSKKFHMTNASDFFLGWGGGGGGSSRRPTRPQYRDGSAAGRREFFKLHLVQYFKVRSNSTLYAHRLGTWSGNESMSQVAPPYPVEARGFLGEELAVGRCNSTGAVEPGGEGAPAGAARDSGGGDDEAATDSALMDDVTHFISLRINATPAVRYFSKLGFRSYEGSWSGLLGGLVDRSVDIAMEPVTAHSARHNHMDFIFPIAQTMRNIYIRQQETSTVRDIFLAPFSPRLIVCVVGMAAALAAAMVAVSRSLRLRPSMPAVVVAVVADSRRQMGCVEALIWITGIMCQQELSPAGGAWMPHSSAARVLLVSCLLFGLVIYNSYAAFITSVLSVRVASLDTVAAVLHSPHFKIGYIQNGADQMYLMSTKDEDLNKFYIRGYSDSKNLVSNAEEGLARAARQDYAFFASQRVARGTLRALSQARGRCSVRELAVPSTLAHVAFPLSRRSPYAKPVLLSLVSLRGGGVLARLGAALVPHMPQCAPPPGFTSARPADVRSALLLLALGGAASAALGISEYCWMNRRRMREFLDTHLVNRGVSLLR